jgi:signal transduction histidine kinase
MIVHLRILLLCFVLTPSVLFAQNTSTLLARLKNASETEKADIYIGLSRAYAQNQPDSAVYWVDKGIHLAEKRNDKRAQGSFLLELGKINAIHRHPELARKFYNEALSIFRDLRDEEGMGRSYDEIGLLDAENQGIASAGKELNLAMKYDKDTRDTTALLETYAGIGRILAEKGQTEKALSYYLRALALYEKRKQKNDDYFVLLENIGNLYLKKGDAKSALRYLQEGITNSEKAGRRDTEVDLLDEEGAVYQKEGLQNKALELYKKALNDARRYHQPEEQAKALVNIAEILKKQDVKASVSELQSALRIAKRIREPQLEEKIDGALADVYRQGKNYKEAMDALQDQHHLLDSLLHEDTIKDIAALDSSYALERSLEKMDHLLATNKAAKKQLDIGLVALLIIAAIAILLWLYSRKIKSMNRQLAASNRVKDMLFSVIGHDLKGPAGSAVQLFELMETEHFTEAEMRSMIADLRKQMTASLNLLQALFEWGKAQLQGVKLNAVEFDPDPVIERCLDLLSQQAAQKNIRLNNSLTEDLLIRADTDHFELIVRNLTANAIKFTKENGSIDVGAQPSADRKEVVFFVQDSGIGISKKQQELFLAGNMKVSFGTNNEKGSGLGLMLVKDFVKANGGRIWLKSREGEGTTFFVALPAAA